MTEAEVVSYSSLTSMKSEKWSTTVIYFLEFNVNKSVVILLQGRSGIWWDCIGWLAFLAWNSARTKHLSTRALISALIPGQNTISLAFRKHEATPWWLEWILESISGLMALGTIKLWFLNQNPNAEWNLFSVIPKMSHLYWYLFFRLRPSGNYCCLKGL